MKLQNKTKSTVGKWILQKVNTPAWRAGNITGYKHYNHKDKEDSLRLLMEEVGSREQFMQQVRDLKHAGLITVKYGNVNTTVEEITVSMEQIDRLYVYEGVENPKNMIADYKEYLKQQIQQTTCGWLLTYEQELYEKLERGMIDDNLKDENILKLLNRISSLQEDVWKRKFSHDVLGNSKAFEKFYEDKIITVLANNSPKVDDSMREDYKEKDRETPDEIRSQIKDRILAEHGVVTYSQTLQLKGGIVYEVGSGAIDTSTQSYGSIINAQSLEHAKVISLKDVKRIVTIENQANYEDRKYDPNVLYVFTHGFFSPKERAFLAQIADLASEDITFEHWSDLDYGGIRIFQFIKNKIFPAVKPLHMDASIYKQLYAQGIEGTVLTESKRKKLERIEAGELEELKQCILRYGKEFEQEALIGVIDE